MSGPGQPLRPICGRGSGLWTAAGAVRPAVAGSSRPIDRPRDEVRRDPAVPPAAPCAGAAAAAGARCRAGRRPGPDAGPGSGRPLLPAALRPVWRADRRCNSGSTRSGRSWSTASTSDRPGCSGSTAPGPSPRSSPARPRAASIPTSWPACSPISARPASWPRPSRRPRPPVRRRRREDRPSPRPGRGCRPAPRRWRRGARGGSIGVTAGADRPWAAAFGAVGAAGRLAPDLASLSLLATARSPLETVRGRRAATVVVHGAGRVGVSLAALLAAAGVGRVHVADRGPVRPGDVAPPASPAADVDRSRTAAAADALRRAAPEVRPAPRRPAAARPRRARLDRAGRHELRTALVGGRVPHLVVGVRETTAVVGPLVLPGGTGCLRCGDLHRCDRDPAWPVVAAQLVGVRRRREEPCDVVLATLAASLAALQCLAHLDGRPSPATGASLELGLADGRLRRRTWPAHPRCDCGAAA